MQWQPVTAETLHGQRHDMDKLSRIVIAFDIKHYAGNLLYLYYLL